MGTDFAPDLSRVIIQSTLKNRFSVELKQHDGWLADSDSQQAIQNLGQKCPARSEGFHDFVEVHACSAEADVDLVPEYAFEPVPV